MDVENVIVANNRCNTSGGVRDMCDCVRFINTLKTVKNIREDKNTPFCLFCSVHCCLTKTKLTRKISY